jgi:hypothetical protein
MMASKKKQTKVYLEVGQKKVFTGALDWPGADAATEAIGSGHKVHGRTPAHNINGQRDMFMGNQPRVI